MKTLKIISLVFITITFSSCYFLDRFIPEEYFAEDDHTNQKHYTEIKQTEHSEYVWISHISGIQCEISFFSNLNQAIVSLKDLGVISYDSNVYHGASRAVCGSSTGTLYYAKIKSKDLRRIKNTMWRMTDRILH